MRTPFTFEDDKELVQLDRSYVDRGSRLSWSDVARRMRRTSHTATTLKQRLRTLKRTWGGDLTRFPPNLFTPVRRPCGRPPAVTRLFRERISSRSTASTPPRASTAPNRGLDPKSSSRPRDLDVSDIHSASPPHDDLTASVAGDSGANATKMSAENDQRDDQAGRNQSKDASVVDDGKGGEYKGLEPQEIDAAAMLAKCSTPTSPSRLGQQVADIFEDIPREVVAQGNQPHRNAGELMPAGVNILLAQLGDIDGRDIFLDIGAGVGNIVIQVALGTGVRLAIGIELRSDIHRLGMEMIDKTLHAFSVRRHIQLECKDIASFPFSYTPPYADATIVYWNNLLFEPHVIEFVKRQPCGMVLLRFLVSSVNFCARHRPTCSSEFCSSFELMKELDLPCSWKAALQRVCVYKSIWVE